MSDTVAGAVTIGGRLPEAVHRPSSLDELAELVRRRDGRTLAPVGNGKHLGLGNPPREPFDAVLLADALGRTYAHQEDDLTLVASANVTLGELADGLARRGQRLPLDPPAGPAATLGGVLATNLGGPLRGRFGLPRDLVLGMTVLRADGQLVRAGGRVVKNVTGYDLMRLWCGSLGTLGIITEVALRVYPLAETVSVLSRAASLAEALGVVDRVYRADIRPEVAEVTAAGDDSTILLRVPAAAAAAAMTVAGGRASVTPDDTAMYEAARDAGYAEDGLVVNVVTAPSRLAWAFDLLKAHAPSTLIARPLSPAVRAAWDRGLAPAEETVAAAVRALRDGLGGGYGSVTIERQPGGWAIDPWGTPRDGLAIMRRLKEAYDPEGRLNLGRFAGGI